MHLNKEFVFISLILILLAFIFFPLITLAADFKTPDESGNLVLSKEESTKNPFVSGNSVKVLSDVKGDLFIFGNMISVTGDVENNVFVFGNSVDINGKIGGDLFAFCNTLQINSEVKGDAFCFLNHIMLSKLGLIGRDLFITGGTAQLYGSVGRDSKLSCGNVYISGNIGRNVNAKTKDIKVGSTAVVKGDLIYKSQNEAVIEDGANIYGRKEFNKVEPKERKPLDRQGRYFGWFFWLKLIISIVTGLVFVYLFGNFTHPTVKESLSKFWSSLGIGFAGLVLMPIAVVIILVTIVGSALAGIFASLYILMLCISIALAGVILGSLLLKLIKKENDYPLNWLSVILGTVVLSFVRLVSFVGWIPSFVFSLIGLGAMFKLTFKFLSGKKA